MAHFSSIIPHAHSSWVEVWYGDDKIGPPTPLIEFNQAYTRNAADDRILAVNTITLNGTFIISPSGDYNSMYANQETLRTIFNEDGKQFSLRAGPANTVIAPGEYIASGIYPQIRSITFPEDIQVKFFKYQVVLEYDDPDTANSGLLESITNNWTWSENAEEQTVDINHNISIKGRSTATSGTPNNAYINARDYGNTLLGLDKVPSGSPIFVQQSQGLLYEIATQRTESLSVSDGTFTATETFKVASGVFPWNHSRRYSFETTDAEVTSVQVQGTIQGFGRTNIGPSGNIGLNNATSGWLNHIKPSLYTDAAKFYADLQIGNTLLTTLNSLSVSQIPFLGRLEYTASFSDDPADNLPSGIAERSVTVDRQDPVEVLARFDIPFRSLGSVTQPMGTPTDGKITINANARAKYTGDVEADVNRAIAQVESDLNSVKPDPNSSEFISIVLDNVSQNHNVVGLTATATLSYTFTLDLAGVNAASGSIILSRYAGGLGV